MRSNHICALVLVVCTSVAALASTPVPVTMPAAAASAASPATSPLPSFPEWFGDTGTTRKRMELIRQTSIVDYELSLEEKRKQLEKTRMERLGSTAVDDGLYVLSAVGFDGKRIADISLPDGSVRSVKVGDALANGTVTQVGMHTVTVTIGKRTRVIGAKKPVTITK